MEVQPQVTVEQSLGAHLHRSGSPYAELQTRPSICRPGVPSSAAVAFVQGIVACLKTVPSEPSPHTQLKELETDNLRRNTRQPQVP